MKKLIISPQAGMCNRLRAICSAMLLARLSGRKVYHCWTEEAPHESDIEVIRHMRESSWSTFFVEDPAIPYHGVDEATGIDQVFSEWGRSDHWYPMQSSAIRRCCWQGELNVERTSADSILNSQVDCILLETSLCLKPSFMSRSRFESALSEIYHKHFNPLPVFLRAATEFLRQGPYVGIHIRRTDHLKYWPGAHMDEKAWKKRIRRNVDPGETVYICSDDKLFTAALTNSMPEYRILGAEAIFADSPKCQAFFEFLCLSQSLRIYGTIGSSFSMEAARYGGRPFTLCSAGRLRNFREKLRGTFFISSHSHLDR